MRGAVGNPAGRFETRALAPLDDDVWWEVEDDDRPVPTTVTPDHTRTILSRNTSPDVPFSISINPYRGCEHGCTYCFARATHSYLGLSPGLDFETRLFSKPRAAELLRRELGRRSYRPQTIAVGPNTDAYQPVERRLGITRSVLEVLREFRNPFSVLTKSSGIVRDLDILSDMGRRGMASVMISVTSLDPVLARTMEPRAAAPARRLATIRRIADAGVPVGVLASPMIPGLNDHELDRILAAAAEAGAASANYILLRLPHELGTVFSDWLRSAYPSRAERVLALVRDTRGGNLYDGTVGRRMSGTGPYAQALRRRYELARRRHGLTERHHELDTSRFRVPAPGGQRSLFEDDEQA